MRNSQNSLLGKNNRQTGRCAFVFSPQTQSPYRENTFSYGNAASAQLVGGINLYAYSPNPISNVDPMGHSPVAGAVGGAKIGTIIWPGPGTIIGGVIGIGIGVIGGKWLWDNVPGIVMNEQASCPDNPPPIPDDPTQSPGEGWIWKGNGPPGSSKGNWVKPETDEKLHPDLGHLPPKGPHWGYTDGSGNKWDRFPDGSWRPAQ